MKPVLFAIFILASICAAAQEENSLTQVLFYDANWKPVKPKKAAFLLEQKYINDTLWEWNYYHTKSPRFLSVQFKDQKGSTRNGHYITYTPGGYPDTSGYYLNGKKHGEWTIMASNYQLLYELHYINGELINKFDSVQAKENTSRYIDSLRGTETKIFTRVEVESEFPGGAGAWSKYMRKNLVYPEESLANNIMGDVIVQFIVNKEGYVTSVDIAKSAEYYLDKEALRFISSSPKWTPATQGGKPVKSYKKQPIYFRF
jgi:protein TonB